MEMELEGYEYHVDVGPAESIAGGRYGFAATVVDLRRLVLAVVFLSGVACQDRSLTGPPACTGAVTVAVGTGTQPVVDWRPSCAVGSVTVVPADVGLTVPLWQAVAFPSTLVPPVRVGASPAGAQVWGVGVRLTPGERYTVHVARGGRGDPTAGADSLTFTAQP